MATNTRFGVIRAVLVLQGSPNFGIPKDPFHAAYGALLPFASFRRGYDRSSFLMPRTGLLFWVLVSILSSVALIVVLNLLLLL